MYIRTHLKFINRTFRSISNVKYTTQLGIMNRALTGVLFGVNQVCTTFNGGANGSMILIRFLALLLSPLCILFLFPFSGRKAMLCIFFS